MRESGSDLEHWSDEQLQKAFCAGDRAAEQVLYRRYASHTIALASRLLRDRKQSKDLAHDAWCAVYLHLKTHGPVAQFKPYLTAVLVNRCRKLLKTQLKGSITFDMSFLEQLELTAPEMISVEQDLSEEIERKRLMKAMKTSLAKLSEMEQLAVRMRYLDDAPYAEIAESLGKTEGHARLIVHRALQIMRKELRGRGQEKSL